jgi:hypothetical protein
MERFYKEDRNAPEIVGDKTFIQVDSGDWRKPYILSIQRLGETLQIKLDKDLSNFNITSVKFENQDFVPERSPESLPINDKSHLAVDENYLYIWVPQVERWKRIPLSIW